MPVSPKCFVKNGETIIKIGENARKTNNGHAYIGMNLCCALSDAQENNVSYFNNITAVKIVLLTYLYI